MLPEVSTEAMSVFLERFAAERAPDEHAVLVMDQAGWHVAHALRVPDNVTLVPLPPYSPELNPVERVWLYLRERFLSHRLLNSYDAIVDACCAAWNRLTPSVCAPSACFPTSNRSTSKLGGIITDWDRKSVLALDAQGTRSRILSEPADVLWEEWSPDGKYLALAWGNHVSVYGVSFSTLN